MDTIKSHNILVPLVFYFLRLGTLGFGGPIALVSYMQRDLVEEKKWISREDYVEGLALAQLAPGPLAAQLAIYLGWIAGGTLGATLVGVAFVVPSFLMVLLLSALYLHFGGLPFMQGIFYGVGAAVIAIIALGAIKMVRLTIKQDKVLLALFLVSAVVTVWTESEVIGLFLFCGLISLSVKVPPPLSVSKQVMSVSPWLLTGIYGPASLGTLWKLGIYFATAGTFVFGSGLAIVPFLHDGVVNDYHWLNEQQFLDAVAVAMITPGPVVITVAFIGYLVAGFLGAVVAAIGIFFPCYLFVIIPAKYFRQSVTNPRVKAFVEGVTAAATGAIAGSVVVLGSRALIDIPTWTIAALTFVVLYKVKKIPEPILILASAVVGLFFKTL